MHGHSLVLALLAEGYHAAGHAADAPGEGPDTREIFVDTLGVESRVPS